MSIKNIFEFLEDNKKLSYKERIHDFLNDDEDLFIEIDQLGPIEKYELIRNSESEFNAKSSFFVIDSLKSIEYLESYLFYNDIKDNWDSKYLIFLEILDIESELINKLTKIIDSEKNNIHHMFYFIKLNQKKIK